VTVVPYPQGRGRGRGGVWVPAVSWTELELKISSMVGGEVHHEGLPAPSLITASIENPGVKKERKTRVRDMIPLFLPVSDYKAKLSLP
jgi:hypothetical protein